MRKTIRRTPEDHNNVVVDLTYINSDDQDEDEGNGGLHSEAEEKSGHSDDGFNADDDFIEEDYSKLCDLLEFDLKARFSFQTCVVVNRPLIRNDLKLDLLLLKIMVGMKHHKVRHQDNLGNGYF